MTEEECDLKNVKLARIRKYSFLISMLVFILTSYYVILYVGFLGFLYNLLGGLIFGILFASSLIGSRITHQTNLQWIFLFCIPVITTFATRLSSHITQVFLEKESSFQESFFTFHSMSFAFSIGLGIFISFNEEIEKMAKLIRFSTPAKKSVLNIQDSETGQN